MYHITSVRRKLQRMFPCRQNDVRYSLVSAVFLFFFRARQFRPFPNPEHALMKEGRLPHTHTHTLRRFYAFFFRFAANESLTPGGNHSTLATIQRRRPVRDRRRRRRRCLRYCLVSNRKSLTPCHHLTKLDDLSARPCISPQGKW